VTIGKLFIPELRYKLFLFFYFFIINQTYGDENMVEVEFWKRGVDEKLIPQEHTITIVSHLFNEEIEKYEKKLLAAQISKDEKSTKVYEKVLIEIKKHFDDTAKNEKITFLPLLPFEQENIVTKKGCNGIFVEDMYADICANKCIIPKYSYDEWKSMKNRTFVKAIANEIFEASQSKLTEEEIAEQEELKKKIQMTIQKG